MHINNLKPLFIQVHVEWVATLNTEHDDVQTSKCASNGILVCTK